MTLRVAVFASGGGTNFQSLLDHQGASGAWRIVLLVTDRADAAAIGRAQAAGVPAVTVAWSGRDKDDVARELLEVLGRHRVDLVLLAGFLRLLPAEVVSGFRKRILNIHPALLPKFGGKGMYGIHVHRAVLEAGEPESGATVHFVDEEYDRGAILAQSVVAVRPGDSPEDLAARVLEVEHRLYPAAVDHLCAAFAVGEEPSRTNFPTITSELQ